MKLQKNHLPDNLGPPGDGSTRGVTQISLDVSGFTAHHPAVLTLFMGFRARTSWILRAEHLRFERLFQKIGARI